MSKIYIVMGHTGEFEDYTKWSVIAYTDEKLAERHAGLAEQRAKQIRLLCQANNLHYGTQNVEKNQFDPKMLMDYGGTNYTVEIVEFLDINENDFEKHWFTELL